MFTFVPNKSFGQLLDIPTEKQQIFLKIFDSKCLHMKLSFTDQSFKLQEREREREREDKMNISFAID